MRESEFDIVGKMPEGFQWSEQGTHACTELASRLMAGFLSNPSVVQANDQNGWELANCGIQDLAKLSMDGAIEIIKLGMKL